MILHQSISTACIVIKIMTVFFYYKSPSKLNPSCKLLTERSTFNHKLLLQVQKFFEQNL